MKEVTLEMVLELQIEFAYTAMGKGIGEGTRSFMEHRTVEKETREKSSQQWKLGPHDGRLTCLSYLC